MSESLSRQTREAKGTAGVQVEVREGLCQDALGRRQRVRQFLTELRGGGAWIRFRGTRRKRVRETAPGPDLPPACERGGFLLQGSESGGTGTTGDEWSP